MKKKRKKTYQNQKPIPFLLRRCSAARLLAILLAFLLLLVLFCFLRHPCADETMDDDDLLSIYKL